MKDKPESPKDPEALSKVDIFERVKRGDWYQYSHEPKMQKIVRHSAQMVQSINDVAKTNIDEADEMVDEFLPHADSSVQLYYPIGTIEHPETLFIDEGTFFNYNLQVLSAGKVTIGKHCLFGPNCQIYTPNHDPYNVDLRRVGWQYDRPITIGNDCWFGGSVIVLPNVTIGDNVVVGAGSVVTKDLPSNVIAAGNPARIIRRTQK
ncbi:sugar O-acetyltransferase [Paucilactobacillus suebicus]|uniref:Acetyltransferase n=1 Tax=Paucilactobacillus suebicus DSM 5007 = KCTC 3549 TaxID=1423807 RepID=A0A0R1W7L4_9LACO|nr:sugar O-acetyltransferase [Paucilactobacillus suebicus]KRM11892.1 acetyltransferase [Paucilactobacillus suebicus DSM 5007 = KCTC 3549]